MGILFIGFLIAGAIAAIYIGGLLTISSKSLPAESSEHIPPIVSSDGLTVIIGGKVIHKGKGKQ